MRKQLVEALRAITSGEFLHADRRNMRGVRSLRLVTWNCQGGFHRKAEVIEALQPDPAIIQECECPDRLRTRRVAWHARPIVWSGDSAIKGLAVISFMDAQLEIDQALAARHSHRCP